MARLKRDFITAWVLDKDLPRLAEAAKDPSARALAAAAHAAYIYPVDSQIWSTEGKLLDHVGANDLFADPTRYSRLLDAARLPAPPIELR